MSCVSERSAKSVFRDADGGLNACFHWPKLLRDATLQLDIDRQVQGHAFDARTHRRTFSAENHPSRMITLILSASFEVWVRFNQP